jgi:drug/metabolite transporter (DMT)-like permease
MTTRQASAVLVFVTFLAGLGWLLSKMIIQDMAPFAFMSVRFSLAGLVLLIFCGRGLLAQSIANLCRAALIGFVFAGGMLLWISGLDQTEHMGEAAFISSLSYILIPVLGALFFGEKITLGIIVAVMIALIGLGLLSLQDGLELERGQLLLLLSTFAFALHFLLVSRYARTLEPLHLACMQLLIAGLVASVAGTLTGTLNYAVSPITWLWLVLAALVATSFRFTLQTQALKYASINEAGLIMVLEPVFTALLGIWVLKETMNTDQWLGCGLIFFAVLLRQIAGMQWLTRYRK